MVGFHDSLGMRHHAENVASLVAYARDIVHGSIRVAVSGTLFGVTRIPQEDLTFGLQRIQGILVQTVVAFPMSNRQVNPFAKLGFAKALGRVFHGKTLVDATELQTVVSDQGSRQQAGFAEDLKAVANAENRATIARKALKVTHYR